MLGTMSFDYCVCLEEARRSGWNGLFMLKALSHLLYSVLEMRKCLCVIKKVNTHTHTLITKIEASLTSGYVYYVYCILSYRKA